MKTLISITLFISQLLFGQINSEYYSTIANEMVRTALTDLWGYNMTGELCKLGHRFSGSENEKIAREWTLNQIKLMQLDSVWLQPVMVPNWVRGDVEKAVLHSKTQLEKNELKISAYGGSVGTGKNGIRAKVVLINSFDELKTKNVKGKIVFYNIRFDDGELIPFTSYGKAVTYRTRGAIEAAKYGAVAVMVRSITSKKDNNPHTGQMRYVDSLAMIPSVAIGYTDADYLESILLKNIDLELTLTLSCKTLPDVLSYNIICEIKGSEKPDEFIVVGGHFDSWDISEGAHDDAAGCMQSLEVLYLMKKLNLKPKRTIRCVMFANEENGLNGAEVYGQHAVNHKIEKHLAAIETDAGAYTPRGFTLTADSTVLRKIQSWLPILKKTLIDYVEIGGSGADISRIKNAKALIGYRPDNQRYMDLHHSANDVFSEIHPREFSLGSAAIALLTFLISEEGL